MPRGCSGVKELLNVAWRRPGRRSSLVRAIIRTAKLHLLQLRSNRKLIAKLPPR